VNEIGLRPPRVDDAVPVRQLAIDVESLDVNPTYAYASAFRHFSQTCVVAQGVGTRLLGFVLGYPIPEAGDRLFVWQVAVAAGARGQGLATRMLESLVARDANRRLRWLEATVTPTNLASQRLFSNLARRLSTNCEVCAGLSRAQLGGDHEPENLYRIGAFDRSSA
jgi:L-2,4-diaminobutyric acid acetyltransferase